jgi:periplasmic protein TonB
MTWLTWLSTQDRRDLIRWAACGVVVVFAHAAVAAALIDWSAPIEEGEPGTDAIIVEFQQEQLPTDPVPEVQKVEEKTEPLPEQQSEAMLPPQPKPDEQPVPHEETPPVERRVERAVASAATWRSQIITMLEHNKRYPPKARDRDEQGATQFGFRIDADGRLMSHRIVKGSGSATLDAETLALLERLQPYPPPPPVLVGQEQIFQLNYRLR